MEAANLDIQSIEVTKRKFEIGHIAYKVTPKDDGGLTIDRHEIDAVGWTEKEGTFMELGAEVKKKFLAPTINSTQMGDPDKFMYEVHFVTLEELPQAVNMNINRKKLW